MSWHFLHPKFGFGGAISAASMFGFQSVQSFFWKRYRSQVMPQFMDPLSATATIVRNVGIEIFIVQILQKEIDAIKPADERVEQIVNEIQTTQQA